MSQRKRLHRPEPARVQPIRNMSTMFRQADMTPKNGTKPQRARDGDNVGFGVELGYQVIEDHIRRGREMARHHRPAKETPPPKQQSGGAFGNDARDLAERAFRYYLDLASGYVAWLGKLAGEPEADASESPPRARGSYPPFHKMDPVPSTSQRRNIHLSIESARPVAVDINLHDNAADPTVSALQAVDPTQTPLTEVSLQNDRLSLRIPPGQAVGRYNGVVFNRVDGIPCGTISVQIDD